MTQQELLGWTENDQQQAPQTRRQLPLRTGALISECQRYRYALWRHWGELGAPRLVVIGLNPSTADATLDDPTIRRCIGFAKREGMSGLTMLNLFALRATDPRVMLNDPAPIGPQNNTILLDYARLDGDIVIAAWGVHGAHRGRGAEVATFFPQLRCFGVTKDGHPRHPLYLRGDAQLVPYPRPERASVPAVDPSWSTPKKADA